MTFVKCVFLSALCLLCNNTSCKAASSLDPFGLFEPSQAASSASASSKSISVGLNLGPFGASGSLSRAAAHARANGRGNGAATAEALANAASDAFGATYGTGRAQVSAASSANANTEDLVALWPDSSLINNRNYGSSADAHASSQSLAGSLNLGLAKITAGITNSQASSHSHGQNFGIGSTSNAQTSAKTTLELGLNLGLGNLLDGLMNRNHNVGYDESYGYTRNSDNFANTHGITYNEYPRSRPSVVGSIADAITNIGKSAVSNVQRIGNIVTSPLQLLRPHQRLRSRSAGINGGEAIADANASADGGSSK